ncbi:hypothetical protein GYMLUDRAFT_881581, partial [Collybiopsis luxurians FD-317 M1]
FAAVTSTSLKLPSQCRSFSVSARWLDHYKTLGVSPQASKAQIKSHFYQLSKEHHPDVSKDPKSKEIYTAVSAAYSVLSNDRERRAYDRKRQQDVHPSHHHTHAPHFHPAANHNVEWSRRRPGATHAWARRPPPPKYKTQDPTRPSGYTASSSGQQGSHNSNKFTDHSSTYANAATDLSKSMFRRRTEAMHRERERVEKVSGSMRALQVFLALILITVFAAPNMGPRSARFLPSSPSRRKSEETDT